MCGQAPARGGIAKQLLASPGRFTHVRLVIMSQAAHHLPLSFPLFHRPTGEARRAIRRNRRTSVQLLARVAPLHPYAPRRTTQADS